ncbi:MAG: response regulator [Proteobacteria bacterium]|nr:response regulator [Pseudomonadota bacterium]
MAKILVLDDEPGMRELLQEYLETEGHQVRVACDGVEGYEVYEAYQPDLLLVDVRMPKGDGIELVQAVRAKKADIKVVYITGWLDDMNVGSRIVTELANHPEYKTLIKPFRLKDASQLVREYVGD